MVPENLIIAALAELDPRMVMEGPALSRGMDIERLHVSVKAIQRLLSNPPPMVAAHMPKGPAHDAG